MQLQILLCLQLVNEVQPVRVQGIGLGLLVSVRELLVSVRELLASVREPFASVWELFASAREVKL